MINWFEIRLGMRKGIKLSPKRPEAEGGQRAGDTTIGV